MTTTGPTTEAEDAILGALFVNPDEVMAHARDLRVVDFDNPHNRAAWEAVEALDKAGEPISLIAVADAIRRSGTPQDERLMALASGAPIAETIGQAVRLVKAAAARRAVGFLAGDLLARARATDDIDGLLEHAREGLSNIEARGSDQGPVHIGDAMGAGLDLIEQRQAAPERYGVMTGLFNYDQKIGPLGAGNLITIGGPPGMGKTGLALAFADHAIRSGVPALVFSLEMATQEILERFLSRRAKINGATLRQSKMDKDEWRRLMQAGIDLRADPLWIDSRPSSVGRIVAETRRWHARHVARTERRLGLVVVDYVQLLTGESDEDQFDIVSAATRLLKRTAAELGIPIVELSQLNRESQKHGGPPTLAALKGSGTLEADSDVVIFPWRDPKDAMDRNQPGPAKLIVAKNRHGPAGSVDVWWQADLATFTGEGQETLV
jgi:replicative DNA helicase